MNNVSAHAPTGGCLLSNYANPETRRSRSKVTRHWGENAYAPSLGFSGGCTRSWIKAHHREMDCTGTMRCRNTVYGDRAGLIYSRGENPDVCLCFLVAELFVKSLNSVVQSIILWTVIDGSWVCEKDLHFVHCLPRLVKMTLKSKMELSNTSGVLFTLPFKFNSWNTGLKHQ